MKGMRKIVRGSGFRGVTEYAEAGGELIGGNMSGRTARELSAEFGVTRRLRPDIEKPVWHNALRLPKGEKISNEKWNDIADDYMQLMGFDNDNMYCVFLHDEEDGQHIHIVASRIDLKGNVFYGRNENLISTQKIAELEKRYQLQVTKAAPDLSDDEVRAEYLKNHKSRISKNEQEMGIRKSEQPPKMKLQNLIDAAIKDKPTTAQFLEIMDNAGVAVFANIARTGRMNGFSFEIDGIAFKASQLGKKYSWNQLKELINYDETRDTEILQRYKRGGAAHRDTIRIAENDRAATATAAARADAAVSEPVARAVEVADSGNIRDVSGTLETFSDDAERVERAEPEQLEKDGDFTQEYADNKSSIREKSDGARQSDSGNQNNNGTTEQETVQANADISRLGEHIQLCDYDSIIAFSSLADKSASHKQKLIAWSKQAAALNAESYRLTLTSRRKDLPTFNLGKHKDGEETFYNFDEVTKKIPYLSQQNVKGYDIYITPIDSKTHYIVVDDMTAKTRIDLVSSGYEPCIIQTSSDNNYQAILKVPKDDSNKDIAKDAAAAINQKFGDPKIRAAVQPFRMAGFSNKKQGRGNAFTKVLTAINRFCAKTASFIDSIKADIQRKKDDVIKMQRAETAAAYKFDAFVDRVPATDVSVAAKRAIAMQLGLIEKNEWTLNWSIVDYRVAKNLILQGYELDIVKDQLLEHSPNILERHPSIIDYLNRTISKAAVEAYSDMQKRQSSQNKEPETQKMRDTRWTTQR